MVDGVDYSQFGENAGAVQSIERIIDGVLASVPAVKRNLLTPYIVGYNPETEDPLHEVFDKKIRAWYRVVSGQLHDCAKGHNVEPLTADVTVTGIEEDPDNELPAEFMMQVSLAAVAVKKRSDAKEAFPQNFITVLSDHISHSNVDWGAVDPDALTRFAGGFDQGSADIRQADRVALALLYGYVVPETARRIQGQWGVADNAFDVYVEKFPKRTQNSIVRFRVISSGSDAPGAPATDAPEGPG